VLFVSLAGAHVAAVSTTAIKNRDPNAGFGRLLMMLSASRDRGLLRGRQFTGCKPALSYNR
jgi:hypothetical protein